MNGRRGYGTGSIAIRRDGRGREVFYGRWRVDGQQVHRSLGLKRPVGSSEGLTRAQAEARLRELMGTVRPKRAAGDRATVADVAERYVVHLEALGRKRSTIVTVRSAFRVWLVAHLGDKTLDSIKPEDVEDLMRTMRKAGVGAKSIRNYIGTLSALYRFALHPRRRWAHTNPVEAVILPPAVSNDTIRFLTTIEVEALASAAVPGDHQQLDRALYLTAAMSGLRQGELIGLQWTDVDWPAQRIRVRRSHVLGEFDTTKSRRSTRSVPMSRRLAVELDAWQQASRWPGNDHLVFAEPFTGEPLRRGALMRRYRRALVAAQLEPTHRFHDLRHTFGATIAAAGVPMRTLQEWMGHRDMQTTLIYADYVPNAEEVLMVDRAFGAKPVQLVALS